MQGAPGLLDGCAMTPIRIAPAFVFVFAVALVVSMTGLLAPHLSAQTSRQQLTEYHVPAFLVERQDLSVSMPEYQP